MRNATNLSLSDSEIYKLVLVNDQRFKTKGFKRGVIKANRMHTDANRMQDDVNPPQKTSSRSSTITANKIGVSTSTVEKVRIILDWADDGTRRNLEKGLIGIGDAHKIALARRNLTQDFSRFDSPVTPATVLLKKVQQLMNGESVNQPPSKDVKNTIASIVSGFQQAGIINQKEAWSINYLIYPMATKTAMQRSSKIQDLS